MISQLDRISEPQRCLSCGTLEKVGSRRYCSIECRRKLRSQLELRTGLLRALNTRYATFSFTETLLILDILPCDSRDLFSFFYPRMPGRKPVEDLWHMAEELGRIWWAEKRLTNRRYLASRRLLEKARKNNTSPHSVRPWERKDPVLVGRSLTYLRLTKAELASPRAQESIKAAYRKQALRHHPDRGGNGALFRKIHEAYLQLIYWVENPAFVTRRGLPDKWCYDGATNNWIQPAPWLSKEYRR